MCLTPTYVWVQRGPKCEKQNVPCKKCWQCIKGRVNDFVGRCLCEAATSQVTCTVTLTYASRDDLADKIIHPRHFQLFMKLLRRAGHKVRYMAVGEYGSEKGRAHFHAVLFFQHFADLPEWAITPRYKADYQQPDDWDRAYFSRDIAQMRMVHIREWPHGHIQVDWNADERALRYVCKYLLKPEKHNAWFTISKRPAIGHEWFMQKAELARSLGVVPNTWSYSPPGSDPKRKYMITGAIRRDYLNAITTDPKDKPRMSEWTLKTFEKHERARLLDYLNKLPVEVQVQAFINRRSDEQEQESTERAFRQFREAATLQQLIDLSESGILRWDKETRSWVPEVKGTKGE